MSERVFDHDLITADEIAEFGEVRAMAIRICEIAASNPDLAESYGTTALELYACGDAYELAFAAWREVNRERADRSSCQQPDIDAEAACLLRDGWSPGEQHNSDRLHSIFERACDAIEAMPDLGPCSPKQLRMAAVRVEACRWP